VWLQDNLLVAFSRVNYDRLTLEHGKDSCPETSVNNYKHKLTTQNREGLAYTEAKVWSLAVCPFTNFNKSDTGPSL
jgi:hypothetical protein